MILFLFIWFSIGIMGASFISLYQLQQNNELTISDIVTAVVISALGFMGFFAMVLYLFINFLSEYGDKAILKTKD